MKCVIIANGNISNYQFAEKVIRDHDYVICADGGAAHLITMDILPHIIVGDLDSMDQKTKDYFTNRNVEFQRFPKKKDYTDTELAIEYALEKKAEEITFLGVIGSRMDHTLANITLLLPLANKGIRARIVDEHNEMIVVNNSIEIEGIIGEYLSIIPLSQKVEGITLEGLEYPLRNKTIYMGQSLGVSNRFITSKAKISVGSGNILLIKARD